MNALDIIKIGSNLLREKKISSNILDSEILLSKALRKSREELLINLDQEVDKKKVQKFKKFLNRRLKNEPIAYIIQEKEFWSRKFNVSKDTLIPRPETEMLVDALVKNNKGKQISILDIGTGSGCILLSLLSELKQSHGIGIDISQKAIDLAKKMH